MLMTLFVKELVQQMVLVEWLVIGGRWLAPGVDPTGHARQVAPT
jgi:hypothetical protein